MEEDAEAEPQSYAWESELQRTWDAVEETADGSLRSAAAGSWRPGEKPSVQVGVRRGVMRAVLLVLDCSRHAAEHDVEMKPSRLSVMCDAASDFAGRFFEQNPVSTLAVLVTRREKAEALTQLSCNVRQHQQALRALAACAIGDASLQNALELARDTLSSVASFVSREVPPLVCLPSSRDAGDLLASLSSIAASRVRCSVISLLAEVCIYRRIARETGGEYGVALSQPHLRELLLRLLPPRPDKLAPTNSLVKVGFPSRVPPGGAPALTYSAGSSKPEVRADGGFACPQCGVLHAELPTECPVCALKLLSATDLSKTYHHLFPLPLFKQQLGPPAALCFGCGEALPAAARNAAPATHGFTCGACGAAFCEHCDALLHESLHACPSCEGP
ncbi:hypothetical protein EMIHUDRAFT_68255 [Emiliania huxleyi CCMP1516]|uniref:General transcription factor IIH subunit n=2 Tax=Emiliania huxleyi TaxID=2903 RepID=A0A0D3IAX8_EMIH1|nr:hypothetical protein EMIHUDRAFT_68255 [Emiliania huxleyi CCMP1516]EOD08413.1 hypothetical protein EMIHUDRAFT_68255 [Emiliania huxleyi CCMP1516]|eukprot:XP_005760842.1 hypothetical protein EMIHUDRAFT_68255 [Emiliania huxleyi CCMP1516]